MLGRAEIESNPKAKESMLKEWKGLRDQGVFHFTTVREYDEVVAGAKKNKKEVHTARVHGICVEKKTISYQKEVPVENSRAVAFS